MSRLQAYLGKKTSPTIDSVVRRIDEVSTLPHIALQVIEVANEPSSSAADLKEVIEGDAALCARILRCVNSSAYGTRTKVTNLQQAIAYLGLKQVRNLAITASVSELFKKEEAVGSYLRSQLWQHLVSVGICARLIAMRREFENFEDMFLAGLLHDIGIVFEDQYVHEPFREVIEGLDDDKTLAMVELECLGFAHTVLGARVAKTWKFTDSVTDAIHHHHNSAKYRGEYIDVVRCVEVANLLCTLKGISSVGRKLVMSSQSALEGLSLTKEDVAVLIEDLDREIQRNTDLFQM